MGELIRRLVKLWRLLRVPSYRRGLRHGVAAAIEHAPVLSTLSAGRIGCVVDLGANTGQFALLCRRLFPAAWIIAFEPLAPAAARCEALFSGDPRLRLIRSAVGPCAGRVTMHVSRRADSSSLLPIGPLQQAVFPGTGESHRETVEVAPLDAFVTRADLGTGALLKLDVQGYELKVLEGCASLLDAFDAVYVECSFECFYTGQPLAHELINWLHARGLRLARVGTLVRDRRGVPVQCDLLFLRGGLSC